MGDEILDQRTDQPFLRVAEWLVESGLAQMAPDLLLAGLCERLNRIGVAAGRSQVAFRILHPLFGTTTITWLEHEGAELHMQPDDRSPGSDFDVSPFAAMLREGGAHAP